MDRRARPDERGFTLIELMVVVLIIAILLAIAIPTYLGARERAQNRAAQSNIRNTHTAELVFVADNQGFTQDAGLLTAVEGAFTYINVAADLATAATKEMLVILPVADTVIIGGKSATGTCFYLRTVESQNLARFASSDCSVALADLDFGPKW